MCCRCFPGLPARGRALPDGNKEPAINLARKKHEGRYQPRTIQGNLLTARTKPGSARDR
jgi:hypothetical protein